VLACCLLLLLIGVRKKIDWIFVNCAIVRRARTDTTAELIHGEAKCYLMPL
jgi:hypothetical protein